jgi:hypothetical protein
MPSVKPPCLPPSAATSRTDLSCHSEVRKLGYNLSCNIVLDGDIYLITFHVRQESRLLDTLPYHDSTRPRILFPEVSCKFIRVFDSHHTTSQELWTYFLAWN